ncbi:MAG: hypothetical protein AVDCRST_MAG87-768, partial [uncultured Thermomicrobiales bacterium]
DRFPDILVDLRPEPAQDVCRARARGRDEGGLHEPVM